MADENTGDAPVSGAGKMNPTMIILVVLGVVILVGALFFFMGSRNQSENEPAQAQDILQSDDMGATEEAMEDAMEDDSMTDTVVVKMDAGNFSFKPNVINAKVGQKIRIEFNSMDMQHDFVIDELGVKGSIVPAGKSSMVEFVASQAGEFEFYCSVGNHRQMGMIGTLTVTQ